MLADLTLLWWGLVVLFLTAVSFVLAKRSMKDFEEAPQVERAYGLYLIRNLSALDNNLANELPRSRADEVSLRASSSVNDSSAQQASAVFSFKNKIFTLSASHGCVFSFERLKKGGEQVVALFMPSNLSSNFPELNLLEIEDYLIGDLSSVSKVTKDKSFVLLLGLVSGNKLNFSVREMFEKLELSDNDMLSLQIVAAAASSATPNLFQSTIRCLISNSNPVRRIEIAKKVMSLIEGGNIGLVVQNKEGSAPFEGFYKRTYVPKEVSKSLLSIEDILSVLR